MAGLRDNFTANFYIPLFAGIESAQQSGQLAPAGVYAPGIVPDGTGSVGGIGAGDGGSNSIDANIARPTILTPTEGSTLVDADGNSTSSTFSSTNAQTHAASRWVITLANNPALVVYDSGKTSQLTTLPFPPGAQPDTSYTIKVRYKGSGGGWSDWSLPRTFTIVGCGLALSLWLDGSDASTFTLDGSNAVSQWADKSPNARHLIQADPTKRSNVSTSVFPGGALYLLGTSGYTFSPISANTGTAFIVARWPGSLNKFLGLSDGDIATGANHFGVTSSTSGGAGNTGSLTIDSSTVGDTEGYISSGADATGPRTGIFEFLMAPTVAASKVLVDGVDVTVTRAAATWSNFMVNRLGLQPTYVADFHIAEFRVYSNAMPDSQRAAIRAQLAAKWNL